MTDILTALQPLMDSNLLGESARDVIQEAWNEKLNETKEAIRSELREEFAKKYSHDKGVMVEALDRLVSESLATELALITEEKKAIQEDRARFVARMNETAGNFDTFMVEQLTNEIKELHEDRKKQALVIEKLQEFVTAQLAEEIQEFQQDRQDVVETKVRLVKEARTKFDEMKAKFIESSSKLVQEAVSRNLKTEITQLREDIDQAKKNNLGRKIFETFATEFATSYLNENQEMKKLQAKVSGMAKKLSEAEVAIAEKSQLVESKTLEVKRISESVQREKTLNKLVGNLNKEKGAIMRDLLESVQTSKLQAAYDRYLPSVINGASSKPATKQTLAESRTEVTGNKTTTPVKVEDSAESAEIFDITRLAGIKK